MNIALFANTGMGNEVLKSLLNENGVFVKIVVTRKLSGRFPYYEEEDLHQLCNNLGVKCVTDINVNEISFIEKLKELEIQLIIVSSFHQILKNDIINFPQLGVINFHPSMLPKYRGPNPLNWVLLNSEKQTGVTVHELVKEIDAGGILLQTVYKIKPFQNLGSLFKDLAVIAGSMVPNIIRSFQLGKVIFIKQEESKSTYYKKPFHLNEADERTKKSEILNKLRAFTPYPGFNFNFQNNTYIITSYRIEKTLISSTDIIIHNQNENSFVFAINGYNINMKYT